MAHHHHHHKKHKRSSSKVDDDDDYDTVQLTDDNDNDDVLSSGNYTSTSGNPYTGSRDDPPSMKNISTMVADFPPNIMMLMLDQAREDAFSIAGSSDAAHTPNIDRIARDGVRFTNAYSSTPICTPARQAMLTGKSPWRHGMRAYENNVVPPSLTGSWVKLPQLLADNGYYTVAIGKNHFGYNVTTKEWFTHGFTEMHVYEGDLAEDPVLTDEFEVMDSYAEYFNFSCPHCDPLLTAPADEENGWWGSPYLYNESLHPTSWTGMLAIDWLDQWYVENAAQPFFLKVSFIRPHSPYDPPARWFDYMVDRIGEIPAHRVGINDWDHRFGIPSALCNMSVADTYCGDPGDAAVLFSRAAYYGSLAFVDEWFGKILSKLDETTLLDKTFIIFVADHGDSLGDHNLWRKGYFTEQVASIPMYMRWPNNTKYDSTNKIAVQRNSTIDAVVELRDILPTLADVAKIKFTTEQAVEIDGTSILNLMKGNGVVEWREFIDLELAACGFNASVNWNALTDGKTKFVHSLYDGQMLLFNLTEDPYEQRNLATNPLYTDVLALWNARMVAQFKAEGRNRMYLVGDRLGSMNSTTKCSASKLTENYPCYPSLCSDY